MLKNFVKTAWRSLLKRKAYTLINILGLTVGIISCLLIALYIQHESSFDKFFDSSERIYRIALERIYPERVRLFASSPVTIAPTLLENYPEVEEATRMHRLFFNSEVPVRIGEESFIETKFFFADSNFFKVFSFDFLEGDPESALNGPTKVVLTDETATRYFGNDSALGKTFQTGNTENIVSGVVKALPSNSHMDFDLMGSIHDLPFIQNAINNNSWINPWIYTYIKIAEDSDAASLEKKFPEMVDTYGSANISGQLGNDYASIGHHFNYFLQPLEDIHLHSKLDIEVQPTSSASYIYLLGVVAIFILILSCINFINLSTARSTERAREVGIRKVLGSTRSDLIRQFIIESVLTCFLSFLIAAGVAKLLLGSFNQLIGQSLDPDVFLHPAALTVLVLLILGIGFAAGFYPALVISSVDSAVVLKGSYKSGNKGIWIRNSLIIFQFFITITMISGTLFVKDQMRFLSERDLGFDKEQLLVVRQAQGIGQNLQAFKNQVKQISEVSLVGSTNGMPGDFLGSNIFRPLQTGYSDLRANVVVIDDDFIPTLKINVLEGRGFGEEYADSNSVILNESAVKELGFIDPVGKRIRTTNNANNAPDLTIVGIIEDFNFTSLHSKISPLVMLNGGDNFVPPAIAIRSKVLQYESLRSKIESIWDSFSPDQRLKLAFLDEELNQLYASDRLSGRVFGFFTYVAIIIAFVGLFSLATYVIQLRTKEIGVRKILGASVINIFALLSRNFVRLVLIALILSVPLSYYATTKWLEQFAYHIDLNWIVFIISGILAILLVILAISYQSVKIYLLNPGNTLRSE